MYAKLFIKGYLVLFAINLVLGGYFRDNTGMIYLSLINVVALFVILFQHSDVFTNSHVSGRVLFSADVFAFIAIWFGFFVTYFVYPYYATSFANIWIGVILFGGFFYITCVWLFRMFDSKQRSHRSINALAAVLILSFVTLEGSRLYTSHGETLEKYTDNLSDRSHSTVEQLTDFANSSTELDNEIVDEENIDTGVESMLDDVVEEIYPDGSGQGAESLETRDRLFDTDFDGDEVLNYGTFLPVLKEVYNLPTLDGGTLFSHVSQSNPIYPAFQAAYAKRMIGSNTNPATEIRCGNLMVILGLAEGWELAYAPSNIVSQFWTEATDRGYTTFGCDTPQEYATWSDLP